AWAELSNPSDAPPRFFPGMTGQAHLLLPAERSTVVPARALVHDGVEHYVLVEGSQTAEGSEFLRKPVVVGQRTTDWVEILGGDVYPGNHVVTRAAHELAGFFVPGVLRLSAEAIADIGLRVEPARRHSVDEVVEIDGRVDHPPDRRAVVSAQLAGALHKIHVGPSQKVEAGQEIAQLTSLEFQGLQLELLRAHLDVQLHETSLARLRSAQSSIPPRTIWELESRVENLRNQRDTTRRKLEALGVSAEQLGRLLSEKKLVAHLPV